MHFNRRDVDQAAADVPHLEVTLSGFIRRAERFLAEPGRTSRSGRRARAEASRLRALGLALREQLDNQPPAPRWSSDPLPLAVGNPLDPV